jgi:coenzyme PQQ biosynthesis protein PqqD
MIITTAKLRLSPKVRLRFDRETGLDILLYPERGLKLNKTAMDIARLCTGEWTIDDIAYHLTRIYDDVSADEIEQEIRDFLEALARRGLLQGLS